jgi:hypothetical protein
MISFPIKTIKNISFDPAMLVFILLATLLGGYMRISQVAQLRFPINDGGMFYSMTTDLIANGFHLPVTTSYNAANIAYVYPPLAFYLAGFLTSVFGWPLIDIFRILPAVIATLTIPAFYLLANEFLKSKAQTALATLVFALMPATFAWLIMGGGISRSLGLLFSILTLWGAYRLYTRPGKEIIAATALFGALAILSHPESAVHTAASALLFFFFFGRNKRGLINSTIVAVAIILMTAPWWATVISLHGLAPIMAAARTGGYRLDIISMFVQLNNSNEMFLTFMGCFAVIGIFISLAKGQWLLPLWLLITILSEPRSAPLYITPELAIFIGLTLDEFVLASFRTIEFKRKAAPPPPTNNWAEALFSGYMSKIVFIYLVVYFIMSAFGIPYTESRSQTVLPDDLIAFNWIKTNLTAGNRFAVITGEQPLTDPTAEWFPTLTKQISAATVQGYEWDANKNFDMLLSDSTDLQQCAFQDFGCIDKWMMNTGEFFDYIYLSKETIENLVGVTHINIPLVQSLLASGNYEIIYETENVAILKASK